MSLSLSWSLGVRSLSLSWSLGVRSLSLSWSLGVRSLLTSLDVSRPGIYILVLDSNENTAKLVKHFLTTADKIPKHPTEISSSYLGSLLISLALVLFIFVTK